ncbi:hypothetical protein K3495_g9550 [Podosphaera aphanis]|nr:hypothetical protein K3495_g9550 [Podosphaera aphanis]
MVSKSKLKMALLSEKEIDTKKLAIKLKSKKAAKKAKSKKTTNSEKPDSLRTEQNWEDTDDDQQSAEDEKKKVIEDKDKGSDEDEDEDNDEDNDEANHSLHACIDETDSESDSSTGGSHDGSDEDEEDIPVSDLDDLEDEDKEDLIPHQRLTINNTLALNAALKRISLPISKLPFSEHQSITTSEPVSIPDISDDLNRELAFYAQCLSAVKVARQKLKEEGVPFSRPTDYFAEMVKADEQMLKIKAKLIDEAASKKASAEARKQRDLKKFGKQVQVAKLQERDKERKQTLDKIKLLKRKRQGAEAENSNEADMFDVAVDEEIGSAHPSRKDSGGIKKRQKKDGKFGFGGKKRFKKSGDALSSGDLRGFSTKKMKGAAKARPGKARRANKK